MVIVHLSANQRRIISPEKNENLGQLFKRFCLEFGYEESEYEFRTYLDNDLEKLGNNISASIIKEVSLVQRLRSKEIKKESKNTSNREDRPNIIHQRTKITDVTSHVSESLYSTPQTDASIQKRLPKRSAPKPPVVIEKPVSEVNDTMMLDIEIEIPPPPEFMPSDNIDNNELLFKSVECETEKNSMVLSDHSTTNDSVRETPDSLLHVSNASNSFDQSFESVDSIENVENVENNLEIGVAFVDITIENRINDRENEMDSDSSVEDVYEDEHLFSNFTHIGGLEINSKHEENNKNLKELIQNHEVSSVISLTTPDPKDFKDSEGKITSEISKTEIISENSENNQNKDVNTTIHEIPAPETVAEVVTVQCPIAEMEDNDMSTSSSNSNEAIETQFDQIDGTEKDVNIEANPDDIERQSIPTDLTAPKMRRIFQKCATVDVEPNDSGNKIITEFQDSHHNTNISMVDGHPTDFPLTNSSEIKNPKYFWELPKQGKTMQFLSRQMKTIDIIETPVNKIEEKEPPAVLPKPAKHVQVIVQETPTEQSDRPMYRPRQAKSLYFTAGKN